MENYGLNFGESGAGRAIAEGFKALHLVASGKGEFSKGGVDTNFGRFAQPSRTFFTFKSPTPPVVFATNCNRILSMERNGDSYTVGVISGPPAAEEWSHASEFYIYAEAPKDFTLPEYGLVVNDGDGEIVYSSNMKLIKVAGYAIKNSGVVKWFVDPSNRKIAWTTLGADLSIFINPSLSSFNVKGHMLRHSQGQSKVEFLNIPFFIRPWQLDGSIGYDIGATDSDIFALAIDVTDI